MKNTFRFPALAALALLACAAHAHVTLEYQVATAAAPYKATFKVGHGCGGSPTREIVVTIPEGVRGARPMPKPGWAIELQARPGTQDVARIAWRARTAQDALPGNYYDEFSLVAQMPREPGPVYWPVNQVCEEGRLDWTELPRPGQDVRDLKSPAAALDILPAGDAGAGHHQH